MTVSRLLFPAILAASVLALAAAVIAQYVFGLEPCVLCMYQRIPYAATLMIGAVGTWVAWIDKAATARLAALIFLIGAGVAFYHVGVEQHWWQAATACGAGGAELPGSFEDFRQGLAHLAPAKPCDEVAWSLFGLSMATYNAAASLVLALGCFWAAGKLAEDKTA